jgi:hypothetical protein
MDITRRQILKAAPLVAFAPSLLVKKALAMPIKAGGLVRPLISPFNFATLAAQSGRKVFGGNIIQAPSPPGTNTSYQYAWIYANFSTIYPEWILPQMKNWAQRGANEIRLIGGLDGVMLGTYTESYYESCIAQVLSDIRALGLTLGLSAMAVNGASSVGSFTASQWFAPTQSLITNVLNPNQDIMAYLEAGNQESDLFSGEYVLSNALAALAKAATNIPILISSTLGSFSNFTAANVDVFGLHAYPQSGHGGTSWDSMRSYFYNALATTNGKPILMEEFGIQGSGIYQSKADFLNVVFETCFGHPMCVGVSPWGGQGPSPDGDWTLYNPPGSPLSPTATWTDTVASTAYQNWGQANRDLTYTVSLDGSQAVSTVAANLLFNVASNSVATPTVTNVNMAIDSWNAFKASLIGNLTLTGDPSTQYTITFEAFNTDTSTYNPIGTPLVVTGSVTNQAFNFSGNVAAGNWAFRIRAQATSGSVSGTMTSIAATMKLGAL